MNDYELVFVVHPELDENAFKELRPVGSDRAEDGKRGGKSRR